MAYNRGKNKRNILKMAIKSIAKYNKLPFRKYCEITNDAIWKWLNDHKKCSFFSYSEIPMLRKTLPMRYREK